MISGIRTFAASLVLLVLTFYPTLAFQVYSPVWYEFGCSLHTRCERLKTLEAPVAIRQLTAYWRHQGELSRPWTKKERRHLAEVRPIYDGLAMLFFASLLAAPWVLRSRALPRAARVNVILILLLLPGLLVFRSLWMEVFHPLVFDNELWRNTRSDVSWYFMPPKFFQYSAGLLFLTGLVINGVIWLAARGRLRTESS